jgi:hypothetical protein
LPVLRQISSIGSNSGFTFSLIAGNLNTPRQPIKDETVHRCYTDTPFNLRVRKENKMGFHEKLTSLAVSVMLTTAFLASPPGVVGAPQSAASTKGPILSTAQRQVLMNLMAIHGHEAALSPRVTAALGITRGDEVLTVHQLVVDEPPLRHAYNPLPDGGVMLIFRDGIKPSSYRLDANLKLVAAISKTGKDDPIVIPIPDAERTVQTELAYWAAIADKNGGTR